MEKLVVSPQDLEQAPVFPPGDPVDCPGQVAVATGAKVAIFLLGIVFPALCLVTLIIWFATRSKTLAIRNAWMETCSLSLAIGGLLNCVAGLGVYLLLGVSEARMTSGERPPHSATPEEYPLDSLGSFPNWPSSKILTPKELAAALDSMVFIVARDGHWANPTPELVAMGAFGSGALLFADEQEFLVATNRHVVDGTQWESAKPYEGSVVLGGRSGKFGRGQIVGRHKNLDLLLLRVERHRGQQRFAQPLQTFPRIATGERVVTFGHPQGLFFSLADGLVSRTQGRDIIQITAPVSPGSSGGPVFDLQGRLLGIVTAMWDKNAGISENLNFATRSDALLKAHDWNLVPAGSRLLDKYIAAALLIPTSDTDP